MKRTKRFIATVLVLNLCLLCLPQAFAAQTFGDVPTSHWACANIERLTAAKIIDGYGNGKFGPEDTLTGGQFAKLVAVTEIPDSIDKSVGGAWYMPYVTACKNMKVLTNSQITDWDAPINRYEMALMMENAMWYVKGYLSPDSTHNPSTFTEAIKDSSDIPRIYLTGVIDSYARGLLTGFEDGTFRGSQNMTRAQAAAVICRMSDYVGVVNVVKPKQVVKVVNGCTVYDDGTADFSSIKTTAPIKPTGDYISYDNASNYVEQAKSPVWYCNAGASEAYEKEFAGYAFLYADSNEPIKVVLKNRIGCMALLNKLRNGGDEEFTDRTAHVTIQSMADGKLLWEGDTDSDGNVNTTFETTRGHVGVRDNQGMLTLATDKNDMLYYTTVEVQHNGKTYGAASVWGTSYMDVENNVCRIRAIPSTLTWYY